MRTSCSRSMAGQVVAQNLADSIGTTVLERNNIVFD